MNQEPGPPPLTRAKHTHLLTHSYRTVVYHSTVARIPNQDVDRRDIDTGWAAVTPQQARLHARRGCSSCRGCFSCSSSRLSTVGLWEGTIASGRPDGVRAACSSLAFERIRRRRPSERPNELHSSDGRRPILGIRAFSGFS